MKNPALNDLAVAVAEAARERDPRLCPDRNAKVIAVVAPYGPGGCSAGEVAPAILAIGDALFSVALTYAGRHGVGVDEMRDFLAAVISASRVAHSTQNDAEGRDDSV